MALWTYSDGIKLTNGGRRDTLICIKRNDTNEYRLERNTNTPKSTPVHLQQRVSRVSQTDRFSSANIPCFLVLSSTVRCRIFLIIKEPVLSGVVPFYSVF